MVELRGFEPLTSSMPWKRATNCAIAPKDFINVTEKAHKAQTLLKNHTEVYVTQPVKFSAEPRRHKTTPQAVTFLRSHHVVALSSCPWSQPGRI